MKITSKLSRFAALIFMPVMCLNNVWAQNCDIAQTGVAIYNATNTSPVASIPTGQTANFRFVIFNAGTDPTCTILANSVTAIFDFPTLAGGVKPYIYDGPPSFVSGYFTWTYNSGAEVLIGTNTTAIPNGQGDVQILVKVKGNASGTGSSNLNLTQGMGVSDNIGNNTAGAQLVVSAAGPLPIILSSFTVVPDNCDARLAWETRTEESNFSHFEIEYSPDGRTFTNAGKVQGKALTTGASYKFTYKQLNGDGYYRLKQVDKDGSFEYSKVVRVTTNCNDKSRILVYPNPVNFDQRLVVTVSGLAGNLKGELFNATGQKVGLYNFTNSINKVSVMNLSAGSYMLFVRNDGGEVQSFKIIVTR